MSLGVTHLTGFGASSVAPPAAVTFTDSSVDTTGSASQTVYTFSSQALGAAASDRMIVVAVCSSNVATTVTSVTIGGISATAVVYAQAADFQIALYRADVPTGTTGTVVVTWAAGVSQTGLGVFRVTGANTTPTDTATHTVADATDTHADIDIPAKGVCISCIWRSAVAGVTWTNLTERYDEQVEAGEGQHSGACDDFATAQTGRTITAAPATAVKQAMVIAAWGSA